MGIASFDYAKWIVRYPEFAHVLPDQASAYFDEATLYLNNSETSVVQDVGQRLTLLNMLVSHIAAQNQGVAGQPPTPLVGRIASASEGSVSLSADVGPVSGTQAWYMMTKYGAGFWRATEAYRRFRYLPNVSQTQPLRYPVGFAYGG